MDFSEFQIPLDWPIDAQEFARQAISDFRELHSAMKQMMADMLALQIAHGKAMEEIRELKAKLGTNSTNSSKPPSSDPPGVSPDGSRPSGRSQGAQKGHRGSGRTLFSPDRVDRTQDIFPTRCPHSGAELSPRDLISLSFKRFHQVDLPEQLKLIVTEFRLHTCSCPCGCGKTVTAIMPVAAGNTVVGPQLKSLMSLLASQYRLSKRLIRGLLIDIFGPDGDFSIGCISEAETEMTEALKKPYEEAKAAIQREPAVHVDETSWFLKHKLHWLWVAVSKALTVFFIDPHRSREAFERFLGEFEGFIISDRFSAYSRLSPEDRQICWAHLIRDFRKLVDRKCGAEGIGNWALKEIEAMFGLWKLFLDAEINQTELHKEFAMIKARFGRLLKLGQDSQDPKACKLCQNLEKLWPSLWNFIQRPDILQPTNNKAEQGVRPSVIIRDLSHGSQSERGLRFTERMLTVVATLRKQGRSILSFLNQALSCFRSGGPMPTLVEQPSG